MLLIILLHSLLSMLLSLFLGLFYLNGRYAVYNGVQVYIYSEVQLSSL